MSFGKARSPREQHEHEGKVSVNEGESFFFLFLVRRAGKIQQSVACRGPEYVTGSVLHDGSARVIVNRVGFLL